MGVDVRYRENPNRGIFATRDIDNELFNSLAPSILQLRSDPTEPICLYLDSLGGSVFYAQRILDLITTPTQDGSVPRYISVAIGFAASAAADLLALGDYAIAYPQAKIYYHGTRESPSEITLDSIGAIEASLRETNENFAMRLAGKMFHRLVIRMVQIKREETPDALFHETIGDPSSFITKIKGRLSNEQQELVTQALERQRKIGQIFDFMQAKNLADKINKDAELLKLIVDFEATESGKRGAALQVDVIREDFFQLKGYFHERYWKNLQEIIAKSGDHFLSPQERNEFDRIPNLDKDARAAFLSEKVSHKLHPIWNFVVSLCRTLQQGEHPIPVRDAYWLGLVDEVIGSGLPNVREWAEKPVGKGMSLPA